MNKVTELIKDIQLGKMVILVDDKNRENEGDLIFAADQVKAKHINFMAKEARGLICLALPPSQIKKLRIPLMVSRDQNNSSNRTAFAVSIEASRGVSTGISAADRAYTIQVASQPNAKPEDIVMPGHIFPIQSQEGGVLVRAGHTEASVDLTRLAGFHPGAVICEIMNSDGTMARIPELEIFSKKHNIKIGTIEDLIEYRLERENFVKEKIRTPFSSTYGKDFKVALFENSIDRGEHLAVFKGNLSSKNPTLVRVHNASLLGDVFGCTHTKTKKYLKHSLEKIDKEGSGVLVYLNLETKYNRLFSSLQTLKTKYESTHVPLLSQNKVREERKRDPRDYGLGAQILRSLGVQKIRLLANKPERRVGLKAYGLEIVETISF